MRWTTFDLSLTYKQICLKTKNHRQPFLMQTCNSNNKRIQPSLTCSIQRRFTPRMKITRWCKIIRTETRTRTFSCSNKKSNGLKLRLLSKKRKVKLDITIRQEGRRRLRSPLQISPIQRFSTPNPCLSLTIRRETKSSEPDLWSPQLLMKLDRTEKMKK